MASSSARPREPLGRPRWGFVCGSVLLALVFAALPGVLSVAVAEEDAGPPITRDAELSGQHFDAAEVLREEFRWNEAADAYWKAVEADLENYVAHVRYQECSLRAGDDKAELVKDYTGFLDERPLHLELRLHRLRLDAPAERLPKLDALKKAHPSNFNLFLEVGRANLALGQAKPALDNLERALALRVGGRDDVLLLLAEAEYAAEKVDAAYARLDGAVRADPALWQARLTLARWDLAAGRYEKSVQHADIVTQQRPTYVGAFLVKSEALAMAGKVEEGKVLLQTVYDRITQDRREVTLALADLTARFETDAAFKQALVYYEAVLGKDPEDWRALYAVGWVLERQLKWEEAEEKYRQVAALKPDSADAINSIGYCLFKQGRVSEAQVQFKRALDMDGDFVRAQLNLGATFDAQAKYGDAIKIYEGVLKIPKHKDNLRALINAAFDYESLGTFPKATKLLEHAHRLLPKDGNIMVWLGDNHYFQEKLKDAENWYQQAIAVDETLFFAWRGLGFTLAARERWADAASALERAKKIKPEDLEMYAMLGDIYWDQLKDLQAALDNFQEYMQRGGTDQEVQDAILEIKKELDKKK